MTQQALAELHDLDMQTQLNILQGCISKKKMLPILKHIKIHNGWGVSTNSRLSISTRIPMDPKYADLIVPADKFITSVRRCKHPKYSVSENGRLTITDKGYRAVMPIMQGVEFPTAKVQGVAVNQYAGLLDALRKVAPFMGEDASRPWACGVLIRGNTMYATNNVTVARVPFAWGAPAVVLPDFLVNELLRLKRTPEAIQQSDTGIALTLTGGVYVNSLLISPEGWPAVEDLFNGIDYNNLQPVPEGLLTAVQDIVPFCPDPAFPRIRFSETGVHTDDGEQEATVDILGLHHSLWRAEPLIRLLDGTNQDGFRMDFSRWPHPCAWADGDGTEGLIIGLRES